jgi:hypothetical protein
MAMVGVDSPQAEAGKAGDAMDRRTIWGWAVLAGVALLVPAGAFLGFKEWRGPPSAYEPPPRAFAGRSIDLKETVFVPTLDTPAPEGKSILWCSSFQVAWNHLKADAGGDILLRNGEDVAERLNRAEESEADLAPEEFYAAGGLVRERIVQKIRVEMGRRFPGVHSVDVDVPLEGAVAYAYLRTAIPFKLPFFENEEPFAFTDPAGNSTQVMSFGIRDRDAFASHALRRQVAVLYCPERVQGREGKVEEFILDPCQDSSPHQVLLACIAPKPTLAEMLADVESKLAEQKPRGSKAFGPGDTLLVPDIRFRIEHAYTELQGQDKHLLNSHLMGLPLDRAEQMVDFKLDRAGAPPAAEVKTTAKSTVAVRPARALAYHCDRPFLVCVRKRGARHPFFALWVDNAELLCKRT